MTPGLSGSGVIMFSGGAGMATLAKLQGDVIDEVRPFMVRTKLDATTVNTLNPSLERSIRRAIGQCGGTVANPPTVTDADVASITSDYDRLVSWVKYFLIDKMLGNWAHWDESAGEESQKLSQLRDALIKLKDDLEKELEDPELDETVRPVGGSAIGVIKAGSNPHPPRLGCGGFWL